jgi:hypothetical protein
MFRVGSSSAIWRVAAGGLCFDIRMGLLEEMVDWWSLLVRVLLETDVKSGIKVSRAGGSEIFIDSVHSFAAADGN